MVGTLSRRPLADEAPANVVLEAKTVVCCLAVEAREISIMRRGLAAVSVIVALFIPLLSFVHMFPLVENMPTWDQWSLIDLWNAHYEGHSVLPFMLRPYNGHLDLLPRIGFYAMGLMSHWDVRLDIVASYLATCGTLALLLFLLIRCSTSGLWLAAPVSAQVFSLVKYANFLSGYQFTQNLSQFLATLVIVLLTRAEVGRASFLGAAAAALGATFSWGAGLIAWYVGLVALLLRSDRRRRQLEVWLALTLLSTVVVKLGSRGAFEPIVWSQFVAFFLAVVGKAWAPMASPSLILATSLGAVACALFLALGAWSPRRVLSPPMRPWLLLGLSALGSAGLITVGRSGDGLDQALASHYATSTSPLVVACLMLIVIPLQTAGHTRFRATRWGGVLAVATLALVQPAVVSCQWLPILRSWAAIIHRNSIQIARGTATDEVIRASHHPDPALVRRGVEVMRAHRLSWFHEAIETGPPALGPRVKSGTLE